MLHVAAAQKNPGRMSDAAALTAIASDEANDEAVAELGTGMLPLATLLREQKNWYDDPLHGPCMAESDVHRKEVLHALGPFMQSSADL